MTKRFAWAAVFALASGATACSGDDPEPMPVPMPEPEPSLEEGLHCDGQPVEINSVFMYEYISGGVSRNIVALSPEKDAPSGDYLFSNQRPGFYAVLNRDLPATFDLKSEDGYALLSLLAGTAFADREISSEDRGALRSGNCTFEVIDGEGRFTLDMTLNDGHRLTAKFSAPYQEVDKKNQLVIGSTSRPIQTAFLAEIEEGLYGYYFTAQVIDPDPENIVNCSQWACLLVPAEALDGKSYDLQAEGSPYLAFMAGDLIDRESTTFYTVEAQPGGECRGSFSIAAGEAGYDVSVNCTDGNGVVTTLTYRGEIAIYTEPEKKNEFLIDGELNWEVQSAVVDLRETVCSIYLSSQRGIATVEDMLDDSDRLTLTLPASLLGENGAGFSTSDDVSITYGGRTLDYLSGAVGRIDYAVIDGDRLSLKFFTLDPANWSGTYEGAAHIIR